MFQWESRVPVPILKYLDNLRGLIWLLSADSLCSLLWQFAKMATKTPPPIATCMPLCKVTYQLLLWGSGGVTTCPLNQVVNFHPLNSGLAVVTSLANVTIANLLGAETWKVLVFGLCPILLLLGTLHGQVSQKWDQVYDQTCEGLHPRPWAKSPADCQDQLSTATPEEMGMQPTEKWEIRNVCCFKILDFGDILCSKS